MSKNFPEPTKPQYQPPEIVIKEAIKNRVLNNAQTSIQANEEPEADEKQDLGAWDSFEHQDIEQW